MASPPSLLYRLTLATVLIALITITGCGKRETETLPVPSPATAPRAKSEVPGTIWPVDGPAQAIAVADGKVAVAVTNPNRLLVLDSTRGQLIRQEPLAGIAKHLVTGPDGFYIPAGREVLVVSSKDAMAPTQRYSLPGPGRNLVPLSKSALAVSLGKTGRVAIINKGNNAKVREIDVGTFANGIAIANNKLAVIDSPTSALKLYDKKTLDPIKNSRAGEGATQVIADRRNRLAVIDARGEELLIYTVDPLFLRQRFPVPGSPYGLAYDSARDTLWITLTKRNEVVGLDLSSGSPRELARYATVQQPNSVAVDSATGRLFVAGEKSGEIQVIAR